MATSHIRPTDLKGETPEPALGRFYRGPKRRQASSLTVVIAISVVVVVSRIIVASVALITVTVVAVISVARVPVVTITLVPVLARACGSHDLHHKQCLSTQKRKRFNV